MTKLTRDAVWEMLPWYVNGTLSDDERAEIDAFLATNPECRHELEVQTRLQSAVSALAPADHHAEGSWRALEARVQKPANSPFRPMLMVASVCLAAVLGASLVWPGLQGSYQTLTSPSELSSGATELRIMPAPNADPSDVAAAILAVTGQDVEVTGDGGLVTISVPDSADAAGLADLLAQTPAVAFVGGDFDR